MLNIKKFDAGIRHLSNVSSYSEFEFKCIFVIFFQVFVRVDMPDTIPIQTRNVLHSVISGDMST